MIVTVDDTNLKAIADAIREKNGTEETYKPSEMASAIEGLPSGELKLVKGTTACGLKYSSKTLTITGVEVSKLKHLILSYRSAAWVADSYSHVTNLCFDIETGKFERSYGYIDTDGKAYIKSETNLTSTISVNEATNTITINTSMSNTNILSSTNGNTSGWFYIALYEA